MRRRAFLATALTAAAGLALRRPKPEPLSWPGSDGAYVLRRQGDAVEWVTVYTLITPIMIAG